MLSLDSCRPHPRFGLSPTILLYYAFYVVPSRRPAAATTKVHNPSARVQLQSLCQCHTVEDPAEDPPGGSPQELQGDPQGILRGFSTSVTPA